MSKQAKNDMNIYTNFTLNSLRMTMCFWSL